VVVRHVIAKAETVDTSAHRLVVGHLDSNLSRGLVVREEVIPSSYGLPWGVLAGLLPIVGISPSFLTSPIALAFAAAVRHTFRTPKLFPPQLWRGAQN
jgi:hypothetical protein